MITFTKAQIASILATGVDFLVAILIFRLIRPGGVQDGGHWEAYKMAAGAMGTVSGGVCHFLISRHWVFRAGDRDSRTQVKRYLLVWTGNLLLNLSVLFLLTKYLGMNLVPAKIVVAVCIAVFYNYVLQKRFVFK